MFSRTGSRVSCLALTLSLLASPCLADRLGLGIGPSFATASRSENLDMEYGANSGMSGGIFYQLDIDRIFAFRPEMTYANRGYSFSGKVANVGFNGEYTFGFLDFPLHMRAAYPFSKKVGIYGLLGPELGFKINEDCSIETSANTSTLTVCSTQKKKWHSLNLGLSMGLGFDYAFKPGKLDGHFELRYSLGLTNMEDTPGSTSSVKSNLLQILVGLSFSEYPSL